MSSRRQRRFSFEPGDETVRVFSDGVPERDYPEGCQLLVLCEGKANEERPENIGPATTRPQTHSGKQS